MTTEFDDFVGKLQKHCLKGTQMAPTLRKKTTT